jgi:hemolysin activation/secretion protein
MTRPKERAVRNPFLVWVLCACMPLAWAQAEGPRVQVDRFNVSGNTLLPAAQIDAALAPYVGQRSLAELRQAALAVQALYTAAGYGAVVAFLPEQSSPGGELRITVVEGRVSRVAVAGQQQFSEANVRASLPSLVVGSTPRVREIDAQIQLANENPSRQLEVLLTPGARPGEVEARVQVNEEPVSQWTLGLDNTGNERTGRLRASLGYQHANLWGLDHVLGLQLQIAPEKPDAVTVLSANYRVPFYAYSMALDAFAAYSEVDGGTTGTAAGPLQFSGEGQVVGLRLSKYLPRMGEIDHRLVLGLDHRDYINNCAIVGLPVGACGGAGESVSVQPLLLEYVVQRGGQYPLGASVSLQHNLQLGGGHASDANFAAVRPGSKPRYTLVRFGLFAGATVFDDWQLQGRLSGQFTDNGLVPGEQFGLGGASSIRGYEEREVTGDSGVLASVELYSPNLLASDEADTAPARSLRALLFADLGTARNRLGTPCRLNETECTLGSVGVGLRYSAGRWQLRADLAHAARDGNRTRRGDTFAHFAVSYRF